MRNKELAVECRRLLADRQKRVERDQQPLDLPVGTAAEQTDVVPAIGHRFRR